MKSELLTVLAPKREPLMINGSRFQGLYVRELESASDAAKALQDENGQLRLVVRSVVDEAGNPVFTDADIPKLQASSLRGVASIVNACLSVNGLSEPATADAAKKSQTP